MRSARLRDRAVKTAPVIPPNNLPSVKVPLKVYVDPAVVAHLNVAFPDSLGLVEKLGSLEAARGARKVIDHLHSLIEQQDNP